LKIKWLAKRILDIDGKITGYKLGPKTDGNSKMNGYDILPGDDIPRENAKIQKDGNGEWEVVEDATKKAATDTLKSNIATAETKLDGIDWTKITDFAGLKLVVMDLVKHYRQK